ncbi:SRPBCC family protein [Streptosporangium amethystogenes]|uniref:SRPBCC family protein n=1 Tax=Streptosporangium amethystogenes TaxID=2002 RepID=UPI0004C4C1C9|nr:SRPBCC family protein [Streptosporangium amethystogenes]
MKLEQEFTIPVEVDRAWEVLLDVERIAPCFPGMSLTSVEGNVVNGSVKVKLGPVLLNYNGVAEFKEQDAANHRVLIDAKGADVKGGGNASAQVTATLHAISASSTRCSIVTDLNVTGRPAQFGRGMMLEVGNKVLGQFSANLAASLAAGDQPAPAQPAAPHLNSAAAPVAAVRPAPQPVEALDLLGAARGAALKRLAPVAIAGVAAIALIVWWSTK